MLKGVFNKMHTMLQKLQDKRESGDGGFTLIELLIVIVILGILAAIVVFSVAGISNTSAHSACSSDVNILNTAAEAYYAQNGGPAADISTLIAANLIHQEGPFVAGVASPILVNGGSGPNNPNGYTITYAGATTAFPAGNATGTFGTAAAPNNNC
jgi:prepilin-type N-terminal cleavage/methylation domain-containing protein